MVSFDEKEEFHNRKDVPTELRRAVDLRLTLNGIRKVNKILNSVNTIEISKGHGT